MFHMVKTITTRHWCLNKQVYTIKLFKKRLENISGCICVNTISNYIYLQYSHRFKSNQAFLSVYKTT